MRGKKGVGDREEDWGSEGEGTNPILKRRIITKKKKTNGFHFEKPIPKKRLDCSKQVAKTRQGTWGGSEPFKFFRTRVAYQTS